MHGEARSGRDGFARDRRRIKIGLKRASLIGVTVRTFVVLRLNLRAQAAGEWQGLV